MDKTIFKKISRKKKRRLPDEKWIVAFLSFCMPLGIAAFGAEKTENIPMPENKSEEPAANVETTPITEAGAENPEDSSTDQSGSG
jgi:hypothetical protein